MARSVSLKMKIEFQTCRLAKHRWGFFVPGIGQRKPAPYGRGFSLRCDRCGAERHDCFDSLGGLASRSYVYPSGYEVAADERPTVEQLRLSLIKEQRTATAERLAHRTTKKPHRTPARRGHLEAVNA